MEAVETGVDLFQGNDAGEQFLDGQLSSAKQLDKPRDVARGHAAALVGSFNRLLFRAQGHGGDLQVVRGMG